MENANEGVKYTEDNCYDYVTPDERAEIDALNANTEMWKQRKVYIIAGMVFFIGLLALLS